MNPARRRARNGKPAGFIFSNATFEEHKTHHQTFSEVPAETAADDGCFVRGAGIGHDGMGGQGWRVAA
jgi:hypothetical protein